ncbi:hypothetical protein AB3X31_26380 [Raoultella terrigena]|uniref:hypothetical protein n=1 Tax=Raoultella terrigena TaxID=577 RepID=UPI00349F3448
MKLITVDESVVNVIVAYYEQACEVGHAEGNRLFLRYLHELTEAQRVVIDAARKRSLAEIHNPLRFLAPHN